MWCLYDFFPASALGNMVPVTVWFEPKCPVCPDGGSWTSKTEYDFTTIHQTVIDFSARNEDSHCTFL
jgi:hypothetical protein